MSVSWLLTFYYSHSTHNVNIHLPVSTSLSLLAIEDARTASVTITNIEVFGFTLVVIVWSIAVYRCCKP